MRILFDPAISFWLLVAVGMAIVVPLSWSSSRRALRWWAASQWLVAGVTLVWYAGWCWLLRDGMGPDAVESHGRQAFTRFMGDFSFATLVVAFEVTVGLVCYRLRRRRLVRATV